MSALLLIGTWFEWFAGTKIGRIVGLIGLGLALIAFVYLKGRSAGKQVERENQREATDRFIKDKEKVDADIADDSDTAVRKRLRKWTKPSP